MTTDWCWALTSSAVTPLVSENKVVQLRREMHSTHSVSEY